MNVIEKIREKPDPIKQTFESQVVNGTLKIFALA